MRYVKSLDGIRGVAVLLVILFHFGYFAPGWIGVQIFFTLSGYLITNILVADKAKPLGAYLGNFYWRRTLRIFPLYFLFLACAAVAYGLWRQPASFQADWGYLLSYTANFARMRSEDIGPYFVHIWSLALEEQFYLLWPFLIYLLQARGARYLILGIVLLSPLARLALFQGLSASGADPYYAGRLVYVLPFTQFDAFATGAAIPLWGLGGMRRTGLWLSATVVLAGALGAVGLLVAHYWHGGAFVASLGYPMYMVHAYQYVWGYSLLNVAAALGIIWTLQGGWLARVFDNAALVRVGKVSYGVYVYHLPILIVGEWALERLSLSVQGPSRFLFFCVYVLAVQGVSEASFRFFESPILRYKDFWAQRRTRSVRAELDGA